MSRRLRAPALAAALGMLAILSLLAWMAPDFVSTPDLSARYLAPWESPPFGRDERGIPLIDYATQGARIVLVPALAAGLLTALCATVAGLVRCAGWTALDSA
nr:hypothetical protein [Deltaproteobacteria bacterium]